MYDKLIGHNPQNLPTLGRDEILNAAGGYVYEVSKQQQFERFLVLGTVAGTYYVNAREHTHEVLERVLQIAKEDPRHALEITVKFSTSGRVPKNDTCLVALAILYSIGGCSRKALIGALPRIARTPTDLFKFLNIVKALPFHIPANLVRDAVRMWYNGTEPGRLEYHVVKYRNREGWSHRDVLRRYHPLPPDEEHNLLYRYAVKGEIPGAGFQQIRIFEQLSSLPQVIESVSVIANEIALHRLTREMVPTWALKYKSVWRALLPCMPATALIRNLRVMAELGICDRTAMGEDVKMICSKLKDREFLERGMIHPLSVLKAYKMLKQHGDVSPMVVEALDKAFDITFDYQEPINKNVLVAVDVSGSMNSAFIDGKNQTITAREAASCMALLHARREPTYGILGFSHNLVNLGINGTMGLSEVMSIIDRTPMGATDCALPIIEATEKEALVDIFIIYTDNETWYGKVKPVDALNKYRTRMNRPKTKLVVVGMTATKCSIADPNDKYTMDVVGFDSATPQIITDFAKDRL